jgi:hypothetical protein
MINQIVATTAKPRRTIVVVPVPRIPVPTAANIQPTAIVPAHSRDDCSNASTGPYRLPRIRYVASRTTQHSHLGEISPTRPRRERSRGPARGRVGRGVGVPEHVDQLGAAAGVEHQPTFDSQFVAIPYRRDRQVDLAEAGPPQAAVDLLEVAANDRLLGARDSAAVRLAGAPGVRSALGRANRSTPDVTRPPARAPAGASLGAY